jgi:hypothetical protein
LLLFPLFGVHHEPFSNLPLPLLPLLPLLSHDQQQDELLLVVFPIFW